MVKFIKYDAPYNKELELLKLLEDVVCTNCESIFSCEIEDLFKGKSSSGAKILETDCPVCGGTVFIDSLKYLNLKPWPTRNEMASIVDRIGAEAYYIK
jgi:hypothetical protein